MTRKAGLLAIACAAVGVLAETLFLADRPNLVLTALDFATGAAICAAGIAVAIGRPESRIGPSLIAAGLAWFAGNAAAGPGAALYLGAFLLYLHRGPFVYALLAYPARGAWHRDRGAIAAGIAAAAAGPLWQWPAFAITMAVLLFVWAAGRLHVRRWLDPPRTRVAKWSTVAFAVTVGAIAIVRALVPTTSDSAWLLVGYDASLAVIAWSLAWPLLASRELAIADIVLEMRAGSGGTVRDRLRDAIADPTADIAFVQANGSGYIDELGRPVHLPDPGSHRASASIVQEGRPIAAILYDADIRDPELGPAVAVASELVARNADLSRDLATEAAALYASSRRLVLAADVERQRIDERLRSGPVASLRAIQNTLECVRTSLNGADPDVHVARALTNVVEGIRELETIGRGLHPRRLAEAGLAAALSDVSEESTVPVDVRIAAQRLPTVVEVAVYFVCTEALANVTKHARANRASIELRATDECVTLVITDDGVGGASLHGGSGLEGIRDRVRSLGGELELKSPVGRGTTVWAAIPLVAAT